MTNLYQSNETYAASKEGLEIPNAQGIAITTGYNKIGFVSNALKGIGDVFTKVTAKLYLDKKQQEAEDDYLQYKSDITKASIDLNNAQGDDEVSKIKLTKIDDVNDLTPEEQKNLLKTHEVHAGNFLYEKYFNKLKAFKDSVYKKYPKQLADKLYTQALRDTYSTYNREYESITSHIASEEKKKEVLAKTSDLVTYSNDYLSKINDPVEKERATKDLLKQINDSAKSGKPLVIGGKEYHIDSDTQAVINKILVGYQKKALNLQQAKQFIAKQGEVESKIKDVLIKNDGNVFGQMSGIVQIKTQLPDMIKDLPDDQKARITNLVNNYYSKIKASYNKKLLVDKGDSLGKYYVNNNGDLDDTLVEDIKSNQISLASFIDSANAEFYTKQLSADSPKEMMNNYINFKKNLQSKFYDIPDITKIISSLDTQNEKLINQKNREILSTVNTLANTGKIEDIDTALDLATNKLLLKDTEKQKVLVQDLRQQRHTLKLLDTVVKQPATTPYTPEVKALLNQEVNGKTPAYIKNVRRKITVKNLTAIQNYLQKGDVVNLNKVLVNSSFLAKDYQTYISKLDTPSKVQIATQIAELSTLHPNLATNFTLLMPYDKTLKLSTVGILAKNLSKDGTTLNYAEALDKYDDLLKKSNKEYNEFKADMRKKYGVVISEAEMQAAFMAEKMGKEDAEDYFEHNIKYIDKAGLGTGNIYIRNELPNQDALNSDLVYKDVFNVTKKVPNAEGAILKEINGRPMIIPIGIAGTPLVDTATGKIIWEPIKVEGE